MKAAGHNLIFTAYSLYPIHCWPGATGYVSKQLCTAHAGRITLMSLQSHAQHHLASCLNST